MSGEAFGPYRLESLLGRGGMGEVWRAVDTGHGNRCVAIKVLKAGFGGDEDFTRRFRRECALAANVTGPHIIPIHSYREIDGRLYIDMPLVDGVDLDARLRSAGPLPPEQAVDIVDHVRRHEVLPVRRGDRDVCVCGRGTFRRRRRPPRRRVRAGLCAVRGANRRRAVRGRQPT